MEKLNGIKERFQSLADKIDQIIDAECETLPDGVELLSIGNPSLSCDKWNIPKGKHIGFAFIVKST